MIAAQPKETDPIEAESEFADMEKTLRLCGVKGPISPDQDILLMMEPNSLRWAARLVENYLEFIRTGEGAMEPQG